MQKTMLRNGLENHKFQTIGNEPNRHNSQTFPDSMFRACFIEVFGSVSLRFLANHIVASTLGESQHQTLESADAEY